MAPIILNATHINPQRERSFVDQHISKVTFVVSTLIQFILGPLTLMLGVAAGLIYSVQMNPNLKLKPNEKVVGVTSAVFAIVGAFASIIKLTPAGAMGGFIFQMVPYASAFIIGNTTYRALKNYIC